jgi:cyclohexanecarboxylate-CoA ligase
MHSANTTMANIVPYAQRLGLGTDDVVLMASPMAHQTGFMYGLMMPIMLGASTVLQDIWEPRQAVAAINAEGVSFTMASTPFLSDLAKTVAERALPCPRCACSCARARPFRARWSSRRARRWAPRSSRPGA